MIAGTRTAVVLASLVLVVFSLSSGSAGAREALSGCSSLSSAVERDDGTVIAIGANSPCIPGSGSGHGQAVLVGLDETGELLRDFGDDGYLLIPEGRNDLLLERPDGGVIAQVGEGLVSYDNQGRPDTGFGQAGVLERPGLTRAVIGNDQDLYLRWGPNSETIGKFDLEGDPDTGFGEGGEIEVDLPGAIGPVVDSAGRLLFTQEYEAIRLLPDGSLDPAFGSEGDGRAQIEVNPAPPGFYFPHRITRIELDHDGRLFALGTGSAGLYSNPSFIAAVDSTGATVSGFPNTMNTDRPSTVGLLEGGVSYALPPGRFDSEFFMNIWATGWEAPISVYFFSARPESWASGTTPLADGSVLAVGGTYVTACPPKGCQNETRMALAKIGPSGQLDTAFGKNGKVVLPADRCLYGSRKTDKSTIRSCRLRPPRVRGSVQVHQPRSANPWTRIKATLGTPPRATGEISQKLVLNLPGWVRVKSMDRLRKSKAQVGSGVPVNVQIDGRKLTATVDAGKAVTFRIRIPRGAIALKASAARTLKTKRVKVRGVFLPPKGSIDSPGISNRRLPVRLAK